MAVMRGILGRGKFKSKARRPTLSSQAFGAKVSESYCSDTNLESIMPARILVLSASVGAGHLRAAEAVTLAARHMLPDATVQNIDVLEMTNRLFRRFYGQFYLDLVNKAPHVLGYFYDLLDQPTSTSGRGDRLRIYLEKMNLRTLIKLLHAEPWDLVINTHFLPAEIIAS